MYKSDSFSEEQMTKYEILLDANKTWDKTLAHFTELFSLRKAYGEDRAANSGFESAAHVHDHSTTRSNITANTKSNLTRNLYIESLKESLAVARKQYALDATMCTPKPPAFDPLTLLQTELAEQRKQILKVMAQNAKLIATLSKGGGGDGGSGGGGKGKSGGGNNGDRHKTPWKEKKLCPNCNKEVVHNPTDCFTLEANKAIRPKGWGTKCKN
jgi:hypothetical protein